MAFVMLTFLSLKICNSLEENGNYMTKLLFFHPEPANCELYNLGVGCLMNGTSKAWTHKLLQVCPKENFFQNAFCFWDFFWHNMLRSFDFILGAKSLKWCVCINEYMSVKEKERERIGFVVLKDCSGFSAENGLRVFEREWGDNLGSYSPGDTW